MSKPLVSFFFCGDAHSPGGSGGFVLQTKGRPRPATHFLGFLHPYCTGTILSNILPFYFVSFTSSRRMTRKPEFFCWDGRSVRVYTRIPIFVCFVVAIDVYTRNRFSESLGSRLGGSDKRHCKQWTSSLFLWIFAWSLYPRPVPLTYQPRIYKDRFISIVTRSLIALWNAVCSTERWSIIGRCFGACQRSSCAEERWPQYLKKTSHLILEMSMNEAFIWLSGLCFIDKNNIING